MAVPGLAHVAPERWDAMCPADSPFLEHRFLHGLERTGTVGRASGWIPLHLLVVDDFDPAIRAEGTPLPASVRIHGAAPSYVKTNSYGEFIFDFRWAEVFHNCGKRYYPKLVVATPFTPVTGARLLVAPDTPAPDEIRAMLSEGLIGLARQIGASSVHWLFTEESEAKALSAHGYAHRYSHQNQWHDEGFGDFEGFLASMRSRARKQIRRERRKATSHGLTLHVLRGTEMDDDAWAAIARLYRKGCARFGSHGYLTDAFFEWIRAKLPENVVCSLARRPDVTGPEAWVAGTLNFQKGDRLYGRYWGCDEEFDHLHFELAFYQLIETCLQRGWTHFEAGAGGDHKVKRGLRPVLCHSAHWIADTELGPAISDWVAMERDHVAAWLAELQQHGTARRAHEPGLNAELKSPLRS